MTVRKEIRDGKSRWVIDIPYRTASGRRRYRRDAQVQTKTAACAEERRLLAELASTGEIRTSHHAAPEEPPRDPGTLHTWEDAVKRFRQHILPTKKPSTRKSYNEILDGAWCERWSGQPLSYITLATVTEWDGELASSFGDSRRRNHQVVLRSVLRTAVEGGQLATMPALPKLPRVGRVEVDAASPEDIALLLNEPDGKYCGPMRSKARRAARLAFALAIYAGLRASEVRGLRWTDVDMKAKTITVRRAICGGEIDTPKSGHQRRIPIAAPLEAMLVEAARKKTSPWAPVAPKADGTVWADHGILQAFKRACARLGIKGQRFHNLRHSFVTTLFEGGAPAHVVQRLAGHASLEVTQRYAHHTHEAMVKAIEVFSRGNGVETSPDAASAGGRNTK